MTPPSRPPTPARRHVRHGRFALDVPPDDAFVAFTPRGEQDWVPGWRPDFPVPVSDDTEPGTVFETTHDGHATIWVVVDSRPGRYVRYARVTPGVSAGTVSVELTPDEDGSVVEVTYELTSLSARGEALLSAADTDPSADPAAWRTPVTAYLHALRERRQTGPRGAA